MPPNDLVSDDLHLRVEESENTVHLHWTGKANARRPAEQLTPFFDELIAYAGDRGAALDFHFEKCQHFNSSTIAVIMQLAQRLEALKIPLVLTYDADLKWQRLTFRAFEHLRSTESLLELRSL